MTRISSSAIESGPGVLAVNPQATVKPDSRSDLLRTAHQLLCEHGLQALTQQRVAVAPSALGVIGIVLATAALIGCRN